MDVFESLGEVVEISMRDEAEVGLEVLIKELGDVTKEML